MTRQQVSDAYNVNQSGFITSPGKFEGEPIFVPALWDAGLNGFADDDNGTVYRFSIPKDDPMRVEFPELNAWLGRRRSIRVSEDDQGFVRCF